MKFSAFYIRIALILAVTAVFGSASAADLPEIRKAGVLRHLGIPYANFVTGDGDGMDVELIRGFAASLGLRYEYVKSDWGTVIEELVGRKVTVKGKGVELGESVPVRGDLIANGLTVLPWRKEAVDFSLPTFPSQIWVIARADARVKPIRPTGDVDRDIEKVRGLLKGRRVLALKKTCLDPDLYDLAATGAEVVCFLGKLNELAPAVVNGEAEMTILDGPDALIALEKWSGRIKIIGPLTRRQEMAVGFPKTSPRLRAAFDKYLLRSRKDGSYLRLVKKYYPTAAAYFPDFFREK